MFRARLLAAINAAGLRLPDHLPHRWVVDCQSVGKGEPALAYLSRYLYRGVISENNIVAHHNGKVTFRYTESKTGKTQTRTLKGEDFLWLVLQHVFPRGFCRVRDDGFLHGNAKNLLSLVPLVLRVVIEARIRHGHGRCLNVLDANPGLCQTSLVIGLRALLSINHPYTDRGESDLLMTKPSY